MKEAVNETEDKSIYNNIPWYPSKDPLYIKTLSMDGYHVMNKTYYDLYHTHNLYGTLQAKATRQFIRERMGDPRPLIISRDSFSGHGQYAQNWLGDNAASLEQLEHSIGQIQSFSLFGIPFVGVDVCGFLGDTNPELCA